MEIAIDFLNRKPIDNSILIGNLLSKGLGMGFKNNYFYGHRVDGSLKGIFAFLDNGMFITYYEDDSILKKIVLLKTIKFHKPRYLLGAKSLLEPIWKILIKSVICLNHSKCHLMVLKENEFNPFYSDETIIEASKFEISKAIDFLIEVEKSFGRKTNTVNELKKKIMDRSKNGDYLFLVKDDNVVSQAMIQLQSPLAGEIGGVYTIPACRGRGYGKFLVSKLCENLIKNNKIPLLIVDSENSSAINLYRSIGFKYYDDYLLIEVEII